MAIKVNKGFADVLYNEIPDHEVIILRHNFFYSLFNPLQTQKIFYMVVILRIYFPSCDLNYFKE